ncbi:MAG: hypothetical protein JXR16_14810 [Bermanella sp.]
MKTLIATTQTILSTRMAHLAGIFVGVEKAVSLVASYWYSAVFYFGYFSQLPNRH